MNSELKEKIIDLLQNKGIYSSCDISFDDYKSSFYHQVKELRSMDLFCPHCNEEKTFVYDSYECIDLFGAYMVNNSNNTYSSYRYSMAVSFKCPTCDEIIAFFLYFNKDRLIKIGQYPSLMDINRNEINKYKKLKLIDEEYVDELKKAEVCASESYYVAAFLYMRRVFENLVSNIFKQNQEDIKISNEDFNKKHLSEKIELLKPYLAIDEAVYNPLYQLLSEGVHGLSEDECSSYYEELKYILLDILEEQESQKRKKESRKKFLDFASKRKAGVKDEK